MFGWLKGLSVTGKVVAALVSVGMVGAVASADPATPVAEPPAAITEQVQEKAVVPDVTKKTITGTADIAFSKKTIEDDNLNKGMTEIRTAGVVGVKTSTYEVTYEDGKEKDRKLIKSEITTAPISQVTAVGTYVAPKPVSNCDPNYSPCVPNVSYDLDCPDIGFSVTIIGSDPHGFDGNDNDGYGCESY